MSKETRTLTSDSNNNQEILKIEINNSINISISNEIPKIRIKFLSVGEAPALTKSKYVLTGSKLMYDAEKFLKSRLPKTEANKVYYFYCGSSFSPTPDQILQDLYDCFQVGGELILQYGVREFWG